MTTAIKLNCRILIVFNFIINIIFLNIYKTLKCDAVKITTMPKTEKKDAVLLKEKEKEDPAKQQKACTGKISGGYWVWPNGSRTHLRFISRAVTRKQALPVGFYDEAESHHAENENLMRMVHAAKEFGLECTVNSEKEDTGNEE